jgi:hypothetical protein
MWQRHSYPLKKNIEGRWTVHVPVMPARQHRVPLANRNGAALAAPATAALLLLGLAGLPAGRAADAPPTPGLRVLWRLPSGETKAYLFRGTVVDGVVQGTLDDGERPVAVEGQLTTDGSFTGVLKREDGSVVGSFAGGAPADDATVASASATPLQRGRATAPAPVDPALGGGTWWITDDAHALSP